MIGLITGTVWRVDKHCALIETSAGIGYELHCPMRTLTTLERDFMPHRRAARLYVDTEMRDSMIRLYGFLAHADKACFRLLHSVHGVGARLALMLLSDFDALQLAQACRAGDDKAFTSTPGIGTKIARRLITELGEKVETLLAEDDAAAALDNPLNPDGVAVNGATHTPDETNAEPEPNPAPNPGVSPGVSPAVGDIAFGDVIEALMALGMTRHEASSLVRQTRLSFSDNAQLTAPNSTQAWLRASLQRLDASKAQPSHTPPLPHPKSTTKNKGFQ